MPTYVYKCSKCDQEEERVSRIADRQESIPCEYCGGDSPRIMQAPQIMSAALPDGVRRKGFQDLREANKLSREAATGGNRKEIAAEIRKMGVRVNKE